jgi:hypothetical protein
MELWLRLRLGARQEGGSPERRPSTSTPIATTRRRPQDGPSGGTTQRAGVDDACPGGGPRPSAPRGAWRLNDVRGTLN